MSQKYDALINNDKYQVFLLTCPANLPSSFATHSWVVINNKGIVSRWEYLLIKNQCKSCWHKVAKNRYSNFKGVAIIPFFEKFLWNARITGYIEGDKGSIAERMVKFIENSPYTYPYRDVKPYTPLGPNCNTYTQWIINNFPKCNLQLPWNAIGKNYKLTK